MAAGLVPSAQSPLSPAQLAEQLLVSGLVAAGTTLTVSGGAAFAYGEIGYLHTDGTVRKAIATGATTAFARCMCITAAGVADAASGTFLVAPGIVSSLSGGTIGATGYVDESTAGAIATAPPSTGNFSKILGVWLSTTVFAFHADPAVEPVEVF